MQALVVDGYNVLYASERYRSLLDRDPAVARERLVDDLTAIASSGVAVTVVFDGAGNPHATGEPFEVAGVTVVYSPSGVEADSVVEALGRAHRESGDEVRVVTSDAATRGAVAGPRVQVTSAALFVEELETDSDDRSEAASSGTRRTTISDRLSPHARAVLLRIRDGSD